MIYRMSDNKYYFCPPLMSDGRHITNYVQNTIMNEYMKHNYGILDNNQYRTFLQQNAETIMKQEDVFLNRNFNCTVPVHCSKSKCNSNSNSNSGNGK
jgi:hypothetical protein